MLKQQAKTGGVPLDRLQRWMQAVIVSPGSPEAAVNSPMAKREIAAEDLAAVVLPSPTLSAVERVGVYQGMYLLRIQEALEVDYPAVRHFLAAEGFTALIARYVQEYPSRSYTLNRLGDHLPDYIRSAQGIRQRNFLHDLARLELAVTQVFDAEQSPTLSATAIAAVPDAAWETARLRPIDAFRLLSFRYPVNGYRQAVREGSPHPRPRRQDTWVAIYRRDYVVRCLDLTRPAHELLQALVAGKALGAAVMETARRFRGRNLQDLLFRWFRDWISEGIFQSIDGV
jgi:hypothetical protein